MALKSKQYTNSYDSIDRSEYYQRMIFPEQISLFNDIWKSEKNSIPHDHLVSFRGLLFGCDPDKVSDILGKPRFVIENHGLSSLIFFYKERINNHRILTQIHFWGKEFFYAGYIFRGETDVERNGIKSLLFDKYGVIPAGPPEKQKHLEDKSGNIISIHDSVNLNIIYLWGDEKVRNAVSQNAYSLRFEKERDRAKDNYELREKL